MLDVEDGHTVPSLSTDVKCLASPFKLTNL